MKTYSVRLNNKTIDIIYCSLPLKNKAGREEDLKKSLVNHDGYDSNIKVTER